MTTLPEAMVCVQELVKDFEASAAIMCANNYSNPRGLELAAIQNNRAAALTLLLAAVQELSTKNMELLEDLDRARGDNNELRNAVQPSDAPIDRTPREFFDYMEKNYPADTIIHAAGWHANSIYRAAVSAYRRETAHA